MIENPQQGQDTVRTALNRYTLPANVEDLLLLGTQSISVSGNALDNHITGNTANNLLRGGDGDDLLDGGAGADVLQGGPGDDTYVIDNAGDSIDEAAPVTLLSFSFQSLSGASFDNPGTTLMASAITEVSAWTTQDTATLLDAGLNGFDPEPNRGRAIGVIGFDDGDPLSTADDGNALLFSFVLVAGQSIDLRGFSFKEQASNGARGNGPSEWLMRINDEQVAAGAVSFGNLSSMVPRGRIASTARPAMTYWFTMHSTNCLTVAPVSTLCASPAAASRWISAPSTMRNCRTSTISI